MEVTRGDELPGFGEWLDTEEAAALWSRAHNREVSQQLMRKWLRDEDRRVAEFKAHKMGRDWFVDRQSMLDAWQEEGEHLLRVVAEERERPPR